jgi:serine/threonine protein kinase
MSYSTSSSSSSSSPSSYSSLSSPPSPSFSVDSDEDPLEEAKISMNLSHPNVVDIYNVLKCEGNRNYIVMEYFDMTLTEFLKGLADKNKRLDDAEINFLMTQLINGLEYLHQNQVIHNDIHWRNVMLKEVSDGSLIIKYVGFSCAKLFGLGVGPQQDFKDFGTIVS